MVWGTVSLVGQRGGCLEERNISAVPVLEAFSMPS